MQSVQHPNLMSGRWQKLSFCEHMANIGSEIERTIKWRNKDHPDYANQAFERGLELLALTINSQTQYSKLKELTRLRECLLDFFLGNNQYHSTQESWQKYFYNFNYLARK